jgi:hypothetical protein
MPESTPTPPRVEARPTHPLAQGICGCPLYLDSRLVEHRETCPFPAAAAEAAAWNEWYDVRDRSPLGAPVRYWRGERKGDGATGTARTGAQVLGGHAAVLWVNETAGAIALTHVERITEAEGAGDPWPPYCEIEARADAAALREREELGEP